MQIAYQLDPKTRAKIKKSFLIGSSGFIVGLVFILQSDPSVIAWLAQHPIFALAASVYGPVVLNTLNEWRTGQGADIITYEQINK